MKTGEDGNALPATVVCLNNAGCQFTGQWISSSSASQVLPVWLPFVVRPCTQEHAGRMQFVYYLTPPAPPRERVGSRAHGVQALALNSLLRLRCTNPLLAAHPYQKSG